MSETFYQRDPYLEPYYGVIEWRKQSFNDKLKNLFQGKPLKEFSDHHKNIGLFYNKTHFTYREWAPGAKELFLIGDFNSWDTKSHPLNKMDDGIWEIEIDLLEKHPKHGEKVKIHIVTDREEFNRIPSTIQSTYQDPVTFDFCGIVWNPNKEYQWKNASYQTHQKVPLIYESHAGIATEENKVGTFIEFKDKLIPYIKKAGYNTIQLMAVAEHPFYGSYGYHVSNFYAPSSRFGTPDDLKALIDCAHENGLNVIMDLVHSHCVKNENEGLNRFDGTTYQYFHDGGKGDHSQWDSKLFNYGKYEVMKFLLSNIRYWMEEFQVDGFRFDGVTSMLYTHHGHYEVFDHYDKYFNDSVDPESFLYLQCANTLIKEINPNAISIAEEVSGMPGLCSPVPEGGVGFDYRLAMSIPDYWIKLLKEKRDEDWDMPQIVWELTNRRDEEKTIAYSESHDQALVGDKTLSFQLMDKEMYWHMNKDSNSDIIDRGIALHKMIRLLTFSLGGNAYLNFMGNEFGHPEWIDFPREGNNFSYQYARRQWSLVQNELLRYEHLAEFDKAMLKLESEHGLLDTNHCNILHYDNVHNCIVIEKKNLIFFYNFNTNASIPDYKFGCPIAGTYKIILNSDETSLGGEGRVDSNLDYHTLDFENHGHKQSLSIYTPSRTVLVFKKK